MPKYRIGSQPFYKDAVLYAPGTEITLPDDVEPSRTWTPLDEDAQAAIDLLKEQDARRASLVAVDPARLGQADLAAYVQELVRKGVQAELAKQRPAVAKGKPTKEPDADGQADKSKRPADSSPV